MDGFSICFMVFQSELIGGGIKLAQVVDARVAARSGASFDEIRNGNGRQQDHRKENS